ncbi:MAG: hypothetical protein J4N93_08205, partial [Chloroflexi bacterium]|nr:hypothetical protein [Chloroflexota bacterium]
LVHVPHAQRDVGYPSGVHNPHLSFRGCTFDHRGPVDKAVDLLDSLITAPTFAEFLTVPASRHLV